MKYKGNFFSLPNESFLLGLSPGELSVYGYVKKPVKAQADAIVEKYVRDLTALSAILPAGPGEKSTRAYGKKERSMLI